MITHGNEIKLFAGNSNRPLAEAIAKKLNTELGGIDVGQFSDGEISVHIDETVRPAPSPLAPFASSSAKEGGNHSVVCRAPARCFCVILATVPPPCYTGGERR